MDKYTKSKKSTYATIELFTLKQKANITNDVLDLPNKNDKVWSSPSPLPICTREGVLRLLSRWHVPVLTCCFHCLAHACTKHALLNHKQLPATLLFRTAQIWNLHAGPVVPLLLMHLLCCTV